MDDSTLDKLFSDGLEEEQEFDFREEDWEELEDRLEEKKKRRFLWVWWAAAACLVLSVGMNVWQAMSLKEIKGEISQMQEILQEENQGKTYDTADSKSNNPTANIKPSISTEATAATQQVIIQRDTIIQRVEVPVYIYPKNANPLAQSPELPALPESAPQQSTPENTPKGTDNLFAEEAQQFIDDQPVKQSRLDLLPALPLAAFDAPTAAQQLPLDGEFLEEYDKEEILKDAKIKRWQMGPTLAYKQIPSSQCTQQYNGGLGWEVGYRASPKWAVHGNYSYNQIHATCNSGPANGVNKNNELAVPNVSGDLYEEEFENLFVTDLEANSIPDSIDLLDYIRNVRSHQSYLQLSLGAKYFLPKAFYVSGRVSGYHNLRRSNQYNVSTESSERDDYFYQGFSANNHFDNVTRQANLIIDRVEVGVGKEFSLNQRWRLPVELYYQQNLNSNEFSLPPLVGVRAGLLFNF